MAAAESELYPNNAYVTGVDKKREEINRFSVFFRHVLSFVRDQITSRSRSLSLSLHGNFHTRALITDYNPHPEICMHCTKDV